MAEVISEELACDLEAIISKRGRGGLIGFLISGYEAYTKKLAEIGEIKNDPSGYDLVIIGTPIWSLRVSSPVRTYIVKNRDRLKRVAFLLVYGGTGLESAVSDLEQLLGKKPAGILTLKTMDVAQEKYLEEAKGFVASLSQGDN